MVYSAKKHYSINLSRLQAELDSVELGTCCPTCFFAPLRLEYLHIFVWIILDFPMQREVLKEFTE